MNLKNKIIETYKKIGTKAGTARELGLPRTSVRRVIDAYYNKLNTYIEKADTQNKKQKDKVVETENNLTAYTSDKYETEDELFEKYNLDKRFWAIQSISHNEWTTPFKNSDDEVVPFVNEQTKIVFKKMIPDITLDIIKEQYKMMGERSNKVAKYKPIKYKEGVLLEIAAFDAHFSKLCWKPETGESYDLKIAKQRYIGAVKDILNKTCMFNIQKILLPLGSDLFHVDTPSNTTTAGTPQDVDSRIHKTFKVVCETLVEVIEMCSRVANVDAIIVPGNHDRVQCFYMGEFLSAYYKNNENININNSPKLRKYYKWGNTLLAFTHGSDERMDSLPLIMAREAKKDWGECDYAEMHCGHFHKKKETKYVAGDTWNGVIVRTLESLSGQDAWHTTKGYTEGIRSASGLLYNHDTGFVAEIVSRINVEK